MQITIGRLQSGGQTGVDRAALDVAIERGIRFGGYCTKGRRAEDGPIPDRYAMIEMPTTHYAARTRRNVETADCTLILIMDLRDMTGGTLLTRAVCQELAEDSGKPFCVACVASEGGFANALMAVSSLPTGSCLNVAGPRESKRRGIYEATRVFLNSLLDAL